MGSTAVKVSADLIESARREAKIAKRSMTQQIEHWARLGRLLERSGALDPARVRSALAAELPLDELTPSERAAACFEVERRIFDADQALGPADDLHEGGVAGSEVDEHGRLVEVLPDGRRIPIVDADAYARRLLGE